MILLLWLGCSGTPPGEAPVLNTPPTSDQEGAVVPIGVDEHGLLRYDITDKNVPLPAWRLVEPEGGQPGTADNQQRHQAPACAQGRVGWLRVERPGQPPEELAIDTLGAHPQARPVGVGRHAESAALPLSELLGTGERLTVWPCQGEGLTLSAAELRARPGRHLLVVGNRELVKLLDLDAPNGDRVPQVRGATVVRVE